MDILTNGRGVSEPNVCLTGHITGIIKILSLV